MYQRALCWAVPLLCLLTITACGSTTSSASKPTVGSVATTIHLGTAAQQWTPNAEGLWFLDTWDGVANEVDPAVNKVVSSISVGYGATNLLATPEVHALWVTKTDGSVSRIDLSTGQVVATIQVSTEAVSSMTATSDPLTLWVAAYTDHTVMRIDMQTNRVAAAIDVGHAPDDLQTANGSVWVCNIRDDRAVQQIIPETNQVVTRLTLQHSNFAGIGCGSIRFTENAVWVMTYNGITELLRLDPQSFATIATTNLGTEVIGFNIGADATAVWIPNVETKELLRVDAQSSKVVGKLALGQAPSRVMLSAHSVWVSDYRDLSDGTLSSNGTGNTVWRITPAP